MLIELDQIKQMDQADALASYRDLFVLTQGEVYLDGNSLGAMPKTAPDAANRVLQDQWANDKIQSWNQHGWVTLADRVGDKIARIIGAKPGEVACGDSTGVNLYKAMAMALQLRPDRKVIVLEASNFPTNNYIVQGLTDHLGGDFVVRYVDRESIYTAIDQSVAVVCLTQVHYKTGEKFDLAEVTALVHKHGALSVWDLCHSAGAFPVDVAGANVDFAVGCTYKYLNGGPGSPAYLFVPSRHQDQVCQPITGWWGHQQPFAFDQAYEPARGVRQLYSGTPSVMALAVMEAGVDVLTHVDMNALLKKSQALTSLFIRLVEQKCDGYGLERVTPLDADQRGSQVSFRHEQGYPIMQALIDAGVIGDFRAPDILRFGFAPLYNRFEDVWLAVERLEMILRTESWKKPQFMARQAVT